MKEGNGRDEGNAKCKMQNTEEREEREMREEEGGGGGGVGDIPNYEALGAQQRKQLSAVPLVLL